ncbi:MAG: hypothetical protein ACREQO_13255 [Candidatus Binatia bacterium]
MGHFRNQDAYYILFAVKDGVHAATREGIKVYFFLVGSKNLAAFGGVLDGDLDQFIEVYLMQDDYDPNL